MKTKLWAKLAALFASLCAGAGLAACENSAGGARENEAPGRGEPQEHAHTYDEQIAAEKYLASAATCTARAKYYYSCECGEAGTGTFDYGEISAAHPFTEE